MEVKRKELTHILLSLELFEERLGVRETSSRIVGQQLRSCCHGGWNRMNRLLQTQITWSVFRKRVSMTAGVLLHNRNNKKGPRYGAAPSGSAGDLKCDPMSATHRLAHSFETVISGAHACTAHLLLAGRRRLLF